MYTSYASPWTETECDRQTNAPYRKRRHKRAQETREERNWRAHEQLAVLLLHAVVCAMCAVQLQGQSVPCSTTPLASAPTGRGAAGGGVWFTQPIGGGAKG